MAEIDHGWQLGSGWIYAAQEVGAPLVKIGITEQRNLRNRYTDLQRQFRVPFIRVGSVWIAQIVRVMEQAVHAYLASSWIEREWFYLHMSSRLFESLVDDLRPQAVAWWQYKKFGVRLRLLRKEYGWTQASVAVRSGLSKQVIVSLEQGFGCCPRAKSMVRLSHAFGATINFLLGLQMTPGEHRCTVLCQV